jgi:starch phosphorylase
VDLVGKLLPRHLEIIYQINFLFLEKVAARFPGNEMKMKNMSIIEEGDVKRLRMANLVIDII